MSWRRAAAAIGALLLSLWLSPAQTPSTARDATPARHDAVNAGRFTIAHVPVLPVASAAPAAAPAAATEPRVIIGAKTTEPLVALTFDLDMTPEMAGELRQGLVSSWINQDALTVLRTTGTPATLFMTGMWAEVYPGLAHALAHEPQFEIENHSYSHPAFHLPCYLLQGVSPVGIAWQLSHSQAVIRPITGITPRYFRFPGGCYDRAALDAVHSAGLIPVEWTVNGTDAFNPNAAGVAAAVMAQVKPGAIVMLHLQGGANAPATGAALRMIIPALRQRGYRPGTVSDLLAASVALQPANPNQSVEALQPRPQPAPPTPPTVPPALSRPALPLATYPVTPCWRWSPIQRIWLRC